MTALATQGQNKAVTLEQVMVSGDLGRLTVEQRVSYYNSVCESLGLNPLTRPFEYIVLNNKLTLYARRDCTDQLRAQHSVSVTISSRQQVGDVFTVTAQAKLPNGRTDESIGAVAMGNLKGDALANALMKAETKAKRRVTLSICGLGWTDETEVETIPGAKAAPDADKPSEGPKPSRTSAVADKLNGRNGTHVDRSAAQEPPPEDPVADSREPDKFDDVAVWRVACEAEFQRRQWPVSRAGDVMSQAAFKRGWKRDWSDSTLDARHAFFQALVDGKLDHLKVVPASAVTPPATGGEPTSQAFGARPRRGAKAAAEREAAVAAQAPGPQPGDVIQGEDDIPF